MLRLESLFSLEKLSEMKSWFLKRRYPKQFIPCEMQRVNFPENKKKSERDKKKGVNFVVTYYPKLKCPRTVFIFYL